MVKQPFLSGWASGSLKKTFTCRFLGRQRFVMHRFRHTQGKRSLAQIWAQERFKRKIWLGMEGKRLNSYRSSIVGMGVNGYAILGADRDVAFGLNVIPPLMEEE